MATHPEDDVRRQGIAVARRVGAKLGLTDDRDLDTLRDSYLVAYEFPAPMMVRIADDMLADLRADVGSRRADRIVALGRDGHSLAIAMCRLDRPFYRQHVTNISAT